MNVPSTLGAMKVRRARRLRIEIRWTVLGIVTYAIVGSGIAYAGRFATFPFITAVSVLVISTVGALILNARKSHDSFSLLSAAAVYYLLAFGVGAVYMWTARSRAPVSTGNILYLHPRFADADLTRAVVLATAGWLLLLFGYLANPLARVRVPSLRLHKPSASLRIGWVVVPLWIAGWGARAELVASGRYFHTLASGAVSSTGSSWIVSAAAVLPSLAAAVIGSTASDTAKGTLSRRQKIFWLLLLVEFAWYLPSGERGSLVGLALMTAAIQYYRSGRHFPLRLVLPALALLIFVVFPFGLFYRGDNRHYQVQPKASLRAAFHQLTNQDPRRALSLGADATFSRFSDVGSLATVMYEGRARMGLSEGRTFRWIPESFIPRALIHDKPDPGLFGNEFGRAYGILDPADRITSVAIGQVNDFYLNFGVIGIIAGMPILGGLYRLINDIFSARKADPLVAAIYAVCLWPFVSGMEVNVALGVFGVLKAAVLFVLCVGLGAWLGHGSERQERSA